VNDTSRELGAAFGVAVLGSAFNTGYRNSIDGHLSGLPGKIAQEAREAPAIAVQLAGRVPGGDALATAAREAFTTGMRYAVLLGMALLAIGALFVWFRGASRTEQVLEDDLDEFEPAAA
jgi:DHA2 family multidrug resistance protein-like MFS transporter